MKFKVLSISILLALAAALPAAAQDHAHAHAPAGAERGEGLAQPGQGAFAAVQEAVELLRRDPSTDWARVDVDALREHLVDMDEVFTQAQVRYEPIPDGVRIRVRGPGRTGEAARRMVVDHARATPAGPGWRMTAAPAADGAVVTVLAETPEDLARVRALGLFGLLVDGGHHQAHHLSLARGDRPHGG